MNKVDRLRQMAESSLPPFRSLALRYARAARDYSDVARLALASKAIWGGADAARKKIVDAVLRLEATRSSLVSGDLAVLVRALEPMESFRSVAAAAFRFAHDMGVDPDDVVTAVRAEMVMRATVAGMDALSSVKDDAGARRCFSVAAAGHRGDLGERTAAAYRSPWSPVLFVPGDGTDPPGVVGASGSSDPEGVDDGFRD